MESWIKLESFGGANTVSGSSHMVTITLDDGTEEKYLVDCGLFQGKVARRNPELNFNLEKRIKNIKGVFITHAHIDHIGRIPAIYRWGYRGPVYTTSPVVELCKIMLQDSAKIQAKDYAKAVAKEVANVRTGKIVKEARLLYEFEDAVNVMEQFVSIERDCETEINEHLTVCFYNAGHSLGSSSIKMIFNNGRETFSILFSGDIGENNPILRKIGNETETGIDAVVMESTYAGRTHPSRMENWNKIRKEIADTVLNGGNVICPAFAVGRTQEMISIIYKDMCERNDYISDVFRNTKIYVDSPLAVSATGIFSKFPEEFKDEVAQRIIDGNDIFNFPNLILITEKDESVKLSESKEPCIIFSTTGMCDAGRILYHLRNNLFNSKCSIIFTGYQAEDTLGKRLLNGVRYVRILTEYCTVRAKVFMFEGCSGHADENGLLNWLDRVEGKHIVLLSHGEPEPQDGMKALIEKDTTLIVDRLELGMVYNLNKFGISKEKVYEAELKGIQRMIDAEAISKEIELENVKQQVEECGIELPSKIKKDLLKVELNQKRHRDGKGTVRRYFGRRR